MLISKCITIPSSKDIVSTIKNNNLQGGDIMYFDDNGDGIPDHATMISSVKSTMINYTAHTKPRYDEPLTTFFLQYKSGKVYILTIK
jgi:hypothetical protein